MQSLNRSEPRALQSHVIHPSLTDLSHHPDDPDSSALRSLRFEPHVAWGKGPAAFFKRKFGPFSSSLCKSGSSLPVAPIRLQCSRHLCAMDKKPSSSKSNLSPQERIELLRTELESIKASTARHKWDMLATEMQDIKDDLTDELQAGLKDAANLIGNLGKRLVALETQVEGLTTALGKISEVTAEASKKGR